jgi:hypothetical protein
MHLLGRDSLEAARWRDRATADLTQDDIGQRYATEKQGNLPAKFGPEIMRLTSLAQLAGQREAWAGRRIATGRADRFVDSRDNGGDGNPV